MSLNPFSHVVLTLVGRGGATAPELADMMVRGRIYWAAPRSQWYAEPKKLAASGHLKAVEEPGRTGPRMRYTLTAKGRKALAAWVRTPAALPKMQHETIVRVLAVDLVDDPSTVLEGLLPLRDELEATREFIEKAKEIALTIPGRGERLLLQHTMAEGLLDAFERWLDDVEALLSVA